MKFVIKVLCHTCYFQNPINKICDGKFPVKQNENKYRPLHSARIIPDIEMDLQMEMLRLAPGLWRVSEPSEPLACHSAKQTCGVQSQWDQSEARVILTWTLRWFWVHGGLHCPRHGFHTVPSVSAFWSCPTKCQKFMCRSWGGEGGRLLKDRRAGAQPALSFPPTPAFSFSFLGSLWSSVLTPST